MKPRNTENYIFGIDPYEINPLYLQDLLFLAKELPVIPHIDHKKLLLDSYREGGYKAVDRYIYFVHALSLEMKPKYTVRQKILFFAVKCSVRVIAWVRKHLNNLNQIV